jgi:hypothetical protein
MISMGRGGGGVGGEEVCESIKMWRKRRVERAGLFWLIRHNEAVNPHSSANGGFFPWSMRGSKEDGVFFLI